MKEVHDKRISRTEHTAKDYSDNEVDNYREGVDHVHLIVTLGSEILSNYDTRCRSYDIEKDVHHEHDSVRISDRSDRILVIVT